MTAAGLDLKNPGGKEILVVGGAALGLGLIYFSLSKKKPAGPAAVPASGHGLGAAPAAQAFTPGGSLQAIGGPATGNAFTDSFFSSPLRPGPPTRQLPPLVMTPVRHSIQGAQEILGTGSPSPGVSPSPGGGNMPPYTGPVNTTAKGIYNALVSAGLKPFQAAGVLGNIQNESLNSGGPEAVGDAGTSFGLVQWHSLKYNPRQYVTGNVAADFKRQITAIVQQFKSMNIGGTTAGQVAGNWAAQFEGCVGCQPGGAQWSQRVFNAQVIYQDVVAGRYALPAPKTKPVANVKPATRSQIRNLFPVVKPKAKPKPAPRHKPTSGGSYGGLAEAIRAAGRLFSGRPPRRSLAGRALGEVRR